MHGRKNTEFQPYIGFSIYQKTRDCFYKEMGHTNYGNQKGGKTPSKN